MAWRNHEFSKDLHNQYDDLNVKCPSKTHMFNYWSLSGGAVLEVLKPFEHGFQLANIIHRVIGDQLLPHFLFPSMRGTRPPHVLAVTTTSCFFLMWCFSWWVITLDWDQNKFLLFWVASDKYSVNGYEKMYLLQPGKDRCSQSRQVKSQR